MEAQTVCTVSGTDPRYPMHEKLEEDNSLE
jgi:hypothetical protein